MKRKVVFLCQRWTAGGIESIINKIINFIDKDKYELEILVSQKETNIFDEELKNNNVNVIQLNDKFEKKPLIRNFKSFLKLLKYLRKEKPDILHINIYNSMSCVYGCIANISKIHKIILHAHNNGFDNDHFKIKLLLNNICKKIFYSRSYVYMACSNEAASFCFNKKALKKCEIINNGIDIDKFCYDRKVREKYRKELKIEDSFVLGNIGRFVEQKNQLRLINIFNSIKKIKQNAKLILIGDGILEKDIKKCIDEKKLKNDVIILKQRDDINKILQAMDCFVFPSLYEGYGIVAIEAQASGLPTFISNNLPKQIFASKNAFAIDLNNSDSEISNFILNKSINLVRESPEMKNYDIRNMVKNISKNYEF